MVKPGFHGSPNCRDRQNRSASRRSILQKQTGKKEKLFSIQPPPRPCCQCHAVRFLLFFLFYFISNAYMLRSLLSALSGRDHSDTRISSSLQSMAHKDIVCVVDEWSWNVADICSGGLQADGAGFSWNANIACVRCRRCRRGAHCSLFCWMHLEKTNLTEAKPTVSVDKHAAIVWSEALCSCRAFSIGKLNASD